MYARKRHALGIVNLSLLFVIQALPIFLDSLVSAWGAILISVTLILLFGEVSFFILGDSKALRSIILNLFVDILLQ